MKTTDNEDHTRRPHIKTTHKENTQRQHTKTTHEDHTRGPYDTMTSHDDVDNDLLMTSQGESDQYRHLAVTSVHCLPTALDARNRKSVSYRLRPGHNRLE